MMIGVVVLAIITMLSIGFGTIITLRFVKLGKIVLQHEKDIEKCLDDIDTSFQVVGRIVNTPLATNDPKVQQIHRELQKVHARLLIVAKRLTSAWEEKEITTGDDQS